MDKRAIGLRTWIVNLVLVILFTTFIISFSLGFILQRNPTSPVIDSRINNSLTNLNNSINSFSDVAESVKIQLRESNPTALDYVFLMFKGAFYIPLSFLTLATSGVSALANVLFIMFGAGLFGGIMVTSIGIIISTLTITVVLLIVKAIRTGESER